MARHSRSIKSKEDESFRTRLRCKDRAAAPIRTSGRLKLTAGPPIRMWDIDEKYDALIRFVQDDTRLPQDTDRPFVMLSQVLLLNSEDSSNSKAAIESVPVELMLKVIEKLKGFEVISLALTSKWMAKVVEAYPQRQSALIAPFERGTRRGVHQHWDRGWKRGQSHHYGDRSWTGYDATLRDIIARWMGIDKYLYCNLCEKFRPTDMQFWRNLFVYEWPAHIFGCSIAHSYIAPNSSLFRYRRRFDSILKWEKDSPNKEDIVEDSSTKQQRRFEEQKREEERREVIIEGLLEEWLVKGSGWSDTTGSVNRVCPAHIFGRMRRGYPLLNS